jgi:hypothetical protein
MVIGIRLNITNRKMFSANITNRNPAKILLKNTADRGFPQEINGVRRLPTDHRDRESLTQTAAAGRPPAGPPIQQPGR